MNSAVLLELAKRWDHEAKTPRVQDDSDSAKMSNAVAKARRETKRGCADTLRTLVKMLGT